MDTKIKELTTEELIKKLHFIAKELRTEGCMYVTADILDEAANRLEEKKGE